jgi:mannose-6-phosphate isomerase-like protein (cupin superfamily)
MATPYTLKKLTDVKDSAAEFGIGDIQEARFAGGDLNAEDTGVALEHLKPNQRSPFGHVHEKAEEIYVVLSGSGRAKLDDDIIDLAPRDALRVSPTVTRAFEAGPDGLELLAFGPHHHGDGKTIQGWWAD